MHTDLTLVESVDAATRRAMRHFPAGSNGEFGLPAEMVTVIERGQGCRVWDTGGREYLDMTMAWGAALVGHARPEVVAAAVAQAPLGANFAAINLRAVELAERLTQLSPCLERVRFVASGTEATLTCLRVARAATGRPKVLKFGGAYHGQHPVGIASMVRPSADIHANSVGAGAPWVERDVLVAPFNDLAATRQIIAQHAAELAAVIVEPLHRCLPPEPGFLAGLREATQAHGVLLVFDEVVTGFRLALGGAQEYYGVEPDLVAYGKALGGGFPLGAFGGRAQWMDVVDEHRYGTSQYAWSASTTGGNPVSAAAAMAALDIYSQAGVYARLHALGEYLRQRLRAVLAEQGETAQVLGEGPLAQVAFTAQRVINQSGWLSADQPRARRLLLELFRRRVFLNPMGTKLYLSLAHDEAAIDEFATRFAEALVASR